MGEAYHGLAGKETAGEFAVMKDSGFDNSGDSARRAHITVNPTPSDVIETGCHGEIRRVSSALVAARENAKVANDRVAELEEKLNRLVGAK